MGLLRQVIKFIFLVPFIFLGSLMMLLNVIMLAFKYKAQPSVSRHHPPECLQDPDLGSHAYVYLEEVRLHYVSAGSDGKPLMLLVHGFPEFWYCWKHQLRAFKRHYRVVAVDLRGYGDSDKPSSVSSYDISKFVEDIKQLIAALGYKKCVLVGHDWGGVVGWQLAQTNPRLVKRFIVMNAASFAAYSGPGSFRKRMRFLPYLCFCQLPWLPELLWQWRDFAFLTETFIGERMGIQSGQMTEEDLEAYKHVFSRGGFTAPLNYLRQRVRSDNFGKQKSDNPLVTCPTLIIWGDQATYAETQLATYSSEMSVQGGATVKVIKGASHWVQMDRPDLVNKYMREFLSTE